MIATIQDEHDTNAANREKCDDLVVQQMLNDHPKMETEEITHYRISHDRGCYHEAGCMKGVEDPVYKPKYDYCNKIYYEKGLADIRKTVSEMIEEEKVKRIKDCIELFSDGSIDEYFDTEASMTEQHEQEGINPDPLIFKNSVLHYRFIDLRLESVFNK